MPASVTPEYLLQGAAYALEQCGLLLRDANLLYRNGSYPSAVALAVFAQEELGRYRILLDLRKLVLGGDHLTTQEIQACCRYHERKQQASMMDFPRVTDPALGKLLDKYLSAKPGSEEWKTARGLLELNDQWTKGIPVARHKQRMSARYVDAVPDGWSRPANEISGMLTLLYLRDGARDYSLQYNRYTDEALGKLGDPELCTALQNWAGRPTLPSPEQPELPPWKTYDIS